MTRQTHNADVVSQSLAAELCAKSDLLSFLQEFLLKVDVAESASRLIACCGQVVVELDRGEFHREQVFLSRRAADDKCDVIGRAGSRSETLHLLHKEGQQRAFVLDSCLRHRIEVGLVGRTATLGNHHEAILCTLASFDIDLCGEVATCVHFVVHVERSILRIAQVVLGERVENTETEGFLILEARPNLLTLLTMNDGCAGILAERQNTLGSCFGVAQELQGDILVVLRSLGVVQDGGNLQVVLAAEHEFHIVESLLSEKS